MQFIIDVGNWSTMDDLGVRWRNWVHIHRRQIIRRLDTSSTVEGSSIEYLLAFSLHRFFRRGIARPAAGVIVVAVVVMGCRRIRHTISSFLIIKKPPTFSSPPAQHQSPHKSCQSRESGIQPTYASGASGVGQATGSTCGLVRLRQHITAARDAGGSLALFGGNDLYWHIRLQKSILGLDREEVCYRTVSLDPLAATHPQQATVRWSDAPLNQPEITLLGQMYGGVMVGNAPLILDTGAQPFFQGTALRAGEALPGLVTGEFDHIVHNALTPPSLKILASSPVECQGNSVYSGKSVANATMYTAPSGARVFDAGTFQWQWGLDNSSFPPTRAHRSFSTPDFQRFTTNIIAYLLSR